MRSVSPACVPLSAPVEASLFAGAISFSPHWLRGLGSSWTSLRTGCYATFYGARTPSERAAARASAEIVRASALEAVPEGTVLVREIERDRALSVQVYAIVSGEELAVFEGGPTHRKAVGRLRRGVNKPTLSWPSVRISSEIVVDGAEPSDCVTVQPAVVHAPTWAGCGDGKHCAAHGESPHPCCRCGATFAEVLV